MKRFNLQHTRWIISLIILITLSACQTIVPPPPDDTRGPKPTELRKHVIEILEPGSFTFRTNWYSKIGDIDGKTQMVMSNVISSQYYITGGFSAYLFKSWQFCVSLINPPQDPDGKALVGVMTISVKNGEAKHGSNYCLWYEPTPKFNKAVKDAVTAAQTSN